MSDRATFTRDLYDNPAFDPRAEALPLSEFEPMVRRLFAQPRTSIYKAAVADMLDASATV